MGSDLSHMRVPESHSTMGRLVFVAGGLFGLAIWVVLDRHDQRSLSSRRLHKTAEANETEELKEHFYSRHGHLLRMAMASQTSFWSRIRTTGW